MARYTGPKRKLSRREGVALFSKDAAYIERKGAVVPGFKSASTRRARKPSDYGVQLREKQKAKRMYGLMEKQFRKYYQSASKSKGNTGTAFLGLLETRLDNVVYRLGFAKSRNEARQFVSHGHIGVDNKKVTIPSYQLKVGQTIAILNKMLDNTQVQKNLKEDVSLPLWLEKKAAVGRVVRVPNRDEMEEGINESLIVEYYSR